MGGEDSEAGSGAALRVPEEEWANTEYVGHDVCFFGLGWMTLPGLPLTTYAP